MTRPDLERRWPFALLAVALIAALLRLGLALAVWSLPQGYLLNADAREYHDLSLALAGLSDGRLPAVFGLSPLTILWGALWHWLWGPSVWAVIAPGIAIGAGTAALTAAIGRRLATAWGGLLAGLLVAVCGPLAFYDVAPLATSLSVFLALLVVWLCLAATASPSVTRAALVGLALGLWIVCRPNAALFVPVALALLSARGQPGRRRRLVLGATLLVSVALTVAPITVANAVRGGVFVPVTASAGINLFVGNNQGATGRLESVFGDHHAQATFDVYTAKAESVTGHALDPAAVSRFWTAQTGREIADDPLRFVTLLGKKLTYALNDFEVPDSWNLPFLEQLLPPAVSWLVSFGLLFPLGTLGLVVLWRRGPPGRRALHGVAAVALATLLAFFVADRFRAPLLPILAIGTSYALLWIRERISTIRAAIDEPARRRSALLLAAAALGVALAATVANLPILRTDASVELTRLCRAYEAADRSTEAASCQAQLTAIRKKFRKF